MTSTTAKRGDLVVIHTVMTSYSASYERSETDHFDVGVVTSVTRDGNVKRWRRGDDFQDSDYLGRPNRGQDIPSTGYQSRRIMPAGQIDVTGALATAACHVWPGHEYTQPYGSLDEVKDALRPHLKTSPGQAALHDAAVTWQAARREADRAYREAGTAANREHAQAGYHTREGRELRNRLDREAMDAHTAAIATANEAYRAATAVTAEIAA